MHTPTLSSVARGLLPNAGARTLGDQLQAAGGRPAGFDYLRIALSFAVVAMHSFSTSYGRAVDEALWVSPMGPFLRAVVPMFFILSGFLVAGSFERCKTITMFLGLRAIRIYPALSVEVILSAFLIGPFVTALPLAHYFTDPEFGAYLLNVTGHIHYYLPGVFAETPFPRMVNAQLWTVPYELECYIVMAALIAFGLRRFRSVAPAAVVGLTLLYFVAHLAKYDWTYVPPPGILPGSLLIVDFLIGVSLYLYRDAVTFRRPWFIACAVLSYVALYGMPGGEYLAIPTLAYVTIYLGLCNPRRLAIVSGADYSYGVYLYGFVVQQAMMYWFPGLRIWWLNIIVCLPLAAVFAALSWHFVEKPALRAKPLLVAFDAARTRWLSAVLARAFPADRGGRPGVAAPTEPMTAQDAAR
ncbi:acyltransferase family protein [Methylobacterium crusticola]|uniref:acyltransferase family protein n=1 Tax=Methylobacterium crusticola TaxID=1697972 RepID=UPI003B8A93E2